MDTTAPSKRKAALVTLGWPDMEFGLRIAAQIEIADQLAGLKHRQGFVGGVLGSFINRTVGILAEVAVARALQIDYDGGLGNFRKKCDVGNWEVRATPWPEGDLVIYRHDVEETPDRRYILVVSRPPHFVIHGWAFAKEAPERGVWESRRKDKDPKGAAWWVPQDRLHRLRRRDA